MQKLKSIWLILLIYPFKMKGITTWPVHKSMGRNAYLDIMSGSFT